jgi:2',3'-cyclic-nucleotide 2'-phosphodiesterase (5'-nucleotidase family)
LLTPVATYPPNVRNLRFLQAESTLTALLDSLGYTDKDVIIVLSHRGWEADSAMALNIHDVDLIVGGHSHTIIEKPRTVAQTIICQAGAKGINLGKIDLEIANGNIATWHGQLIPVTGTIPEDSTLAVKINTASKALDQQLRVPIGKTEIALVPGLQAGRKDALSLGDLLARFMLEETQADIAFTNQGGVRATIEPGPITMMDIYASLPFENTVVTMELTGAQVEEVLDRNFSSGTDTGGRHHFSGIEWKQKHYGTVQAIINGRPIDPKKTYKIATNNFLARGGDGYTVLTKGINVSDTGMTLNELLIRYIERVGIITGKE